MDTNITVAIVSALGGIIAAAVGALITKGGMGWLKKIPRSGFVIIVAIIGLSLGFIAGVPIARALVCRNPCLCAKITVPSGDRSMNGNDAARFKTSSPSEVSWDKAGCAMTVEYYKDLKLIAKYTNKTSGEKINLTGPGSEKTEIKIWVEGANDPSDSVWVWVQ